MNAFIFCERQDETSSRNLSQNTDAKTGLSQSSGSDREPTESRIIEEQLRLIHFIISHGLRDDLEDYLSKV